MINSFYDLMVYILSSLFNFSLSCLIILFEFNHNACLLFLLKNKDLSCIIFNINVANILFSCMKTIIIIWLVSIKVNFVRRAYDLLKIN